jgi:hypothetical protein
VRRREEMNYDDMEQAVRDAENTLRIADAVVSKIAYTIKGRLRRSNTAGWILADIKRELRDFNIHTGTWKDR